MSAGEQRRIVGWKRLPMPFVSLNDSYLVGDTLFDRRTGKPIPAGEIAPVYEGDDGWEETERLTLEAKREFDG